MPEGPETGPRTPQIVCVRSGVYHLNAPPRPDSNGGAPVIKYTPPKKKRTTVNPECASVLSIVEISGSCALVATVGLDRWNQ